jgi:hypothetical protein
MRISQSHYRMEGGVRNYMQKKKKLQGNQTGIPSLKPSEWVRDWARCKSLVILVGLEMPLIVQPLSQRTAARKIPTHSHPRNKVVLELVGLAEAS